MEIIKRHTGKRKGELGVTIHLLKQGTRGGSKSITVHGLSTEQLYEKILFYLKLLELNEEVQIKINKTKVN